MARIYEYQGKETLKNAGIAIPKGMRVKSAREAKIAASEIGGEVVIKAQILTTGRFKAGGIKFAQTPEETEQIANDLLGTTIKGLRVNSLLVEETIDIAKELYVSIIINNSYRVKAPTIIISTEGGVDVEEVAKRSPEKVASLNIDYLQGVKKQDLYELIKKLEVNYCFETDQADQFVDIMNKLYLLFKEKDLRIAEINPLLVTTDGKLIAGDCRLTIDDNSVYRHPEYDIELPRDMDREPTDLEKIAWSIEEGDFRGTGYFTQMQPVIEDTGFIGFHGIGGGGAMLAASALVKSGFKIANYADTSGDPPASKVYRVIKAILNQPVEGYVMMGACLANQEQWHHGHGLVKILREHAKVKPGFPVVLLVAGNKEKETHHIIQKGLEGIPLRWELYGRDYIYDTDYIASRIKALVEEYRNERGQVANG